jgi:hypothetical protein
MPGQTFTIVGNDTLTLNGHVFNDLSTGDVSTVNFPNQLLTRKTGKNGNTIFAENAAGLNADLNLRVMRGSADDQFLQQLINTAPADFPSSVLLSGTFVKRLGDGQGNVISDTYKLSGGAISKIPDGKENVEGDTTQGEAVYSVIFGTGSRSLG